MKSIRKMLGLTCEPHTAGMEQKVVETNLADMMDRVVLGNGNMFDDSQDEEIAEKMKQYHAEETNTWANCPYDFEMEQELSDMGWSQSEIAYIREKYNK